MFERVGLDLAALNGDRSEVGEAFWRKLMRDVRGATFGRLLLVAPGLLLCPIAVMPPSRFSTRMSPCPDFPSKDALY